MYLDIEPCPNCPEGAMATFAEAGPGRAVTALRLWDEGVWRWFAAVSWGDAAPAPARLTPIEESGDGPALLATGGPHGLRLAPIPGPEAAATVRWSLDDPRQRGEPFLICTPDIAVA